MKESFVRSHPLDGTIKELYEAGFSIRDIAKRLSLSRGSVWNVVHRLGISRQSLRFERIQQCKEEASKMLKEAVDPRKDLSFDERIALRMKELCED